MQTQITRIFLVLLAASPIGVSVMATPKCRDSFRFIRLADLQPTQDGLRRSPEEMQRLRTRLEALGGIEPRALKVNIFEDGAKFLRDGHHHAQIYSTQGITEVPESALQIERYTYAEYAEINFADGWVTPFDPRTHFRLAELAGWKKLIQTMLTRGIPKSEIAAFIRAHPEAYSKPKAELERAKDGDGTTRDRVLYNVMMDKTLPIKIGHAVAHIPQAGVIYEVGAGSGALSALMAYENPHLLVVVSDINMEAVREIQRKYPLPNLIAIKADARERVFPQGFLNGVYDSSVVHEIMSYSGFSEGAVHAYHQASYEQSEPGASYSMRDFGVPEKWPNMVRLWLNDSPGVGVSAYAKMSKAQLFRNFAENFRSHDFPNGIPFKEIHKPGGEFVFEVSKEAAVNFLLRISYVEGDSWLHEMKEQYTLGTPSELSRGLESRGYRVDLVLPVRNPFIERNFWSKDVKITDRRNQPLDWPMTNLLIYATRPGELEAVRLSQRAVPEHHPRILQRVAMKNRETGVVFDLIKMPGRYQTFLPYQQDGETMHIYIQNRVRMGGLRYYSEHSSINENTYGGFSSKAPGLISTGTEPWVSDFAKMLADPRKKIGAYLDPHSTERLAGFQLKPFMPSPGGSDEIVDMHLVDMNGSSQKVFEQTGMRQYRFQDALTAVHVGTISDPRLEYGLYQLAKLKGLALPRWVGGDFELIDQGAANLDAFRLESDASLISAQPLKHKKFEPSENLSGFMRIDSQQLTAHFKDKREAEIQEFAVPASMSLDSMAVIPVIKLSGRIYVGLEEGDRAALESRGFDAAQRVIPAWRMPAGLKGRFEAFKNLNERMQGDFDFKPRAVYQLGESYFPSPQQSPERVTIVVAEVNAAEPPRDLRFVPLEDAVSRVEESPDLHTKIGLLRLAHSLKK